MWLHPMTTARNRRISPAASRRVRATVIHQERRFSHSFAQRHGERIGADRGSISLPLVKSSVLDDAVPAVAA